MDSTALGAILVESLKYSCVCGSCDHPNCIMGSNLVALFPISFLQFIIVSVLGESAIAIYAALILARASTYTDVDRAHVLVCSVPAVAG